MWGPNGRATTGWSPTPLRLRRRRQSARLEAPAHEAPAGCGEEQERNPREDQQGQRNSLGVRGAEPLDRTLDDAPLAALGAAAVVRAAGDAGERRWLVVPQRGEKRALDVVPRARVQLDVTRQVLQRLLVATRRIRLVEAAVEPVVDHGLPARYGRCGR